MTVVAEGIEEPEQADHLRRLRSPLGQGYHFSRPVGPGQVETLLRSGTIVTESGTGTGDRADPEAPAAAA